MSEIFGSVTTTPINPNAFSGVVDPTYTPTSKNAQSGLAVAEAVSHAKYFEIEQNGTIYLKPQYRGATIDFATDKSILKDLGKANCDILLNYAKSDIGVGSEGSETNSLPETLYIPNEVNGIEVKYLAPAMFAYNKRVKQIILPSFVIAIPTECFAYAIHLEKVLNTKQIKSIGYASFYACGVLELDMPNLTTLGKRAFMKAGHLKKINVGKITAFPNECCGHCASLKEIVNSNIITTVGDIAFYNTPSLKKADFISDLKNIGAYAFNRCSINFDWVAFKEANGDTVKYGTNATPLQTNTSLDKKHYNIRTESCELPAPLRIEQSNPEWVNKQINNFYNFNMGCVFFSIMNAYCGIKGVKYDEPYSLVEINKSMGVPQQYQENITDVTTLDSYFKTLDEESKYPKQAGKIIKYMGDSTNEAIKGYKHPIDSNPNPISTDNYFEKGVYYQLRTYKNNGSYYWTWLKIGTNITNIDVFTAGSKYVSFYQWVDGIGLVVEEVIRQEPKNYSKIIEALNKGKYVVLTVQNSPSANKGHAILLYGVKSNGEVLFVDSSVPGLIALEDYRAITGSAFLQNIIHQDSADCSIISEGETKTLNQKVNEVYLIVEEILKNMNLSITRTHYEQIIPKEDKQTLTVSLDFEPKLVTLNYTELATKLYNYMPRVVTDPEFNELSIKQINGLYSTLWINGDFSKKGADILISSYARVLVANDEIVYGTSSSNNNDSVNVSRNADTNKWDVTIGVPTDNANYKNYQIVGNQNGEVKYDLFIVG